MKKAFRILAYSLLAIVLIICGLLAYVRFALPNVGAAPVLKVEGTAVQVERGRYLANSVTVCMDCHSTRDWNKFLAPVQAGTTGKGGERFDQKQGFPGVYYSKNITPSGVSRYIDGELYRLITTGVTKEGRAIFPVMPFPYYGRMDPEDIKSIIAYIRTLTPIENQVPESTSDFPMNFIINTIPHKAIPQERPARSDSLAYGAYITNAAACMECHTPVKMGQIIPELAFSGGRPFASPDGSVVRSSNLTPDAKTGLGKWTSSMFTNRFKAYSDSGYHAPDVHPGDFNSPMPWMMYSKMDSSDLVAIYNYLKQVKPVENTIVKFTSNQHTKNE